MMRPSKMSLLCCLAFVTLSNSLAPAETAIVQKMTGKWTAKLKDKETPLSVGKPFDLDSHLTGESERGRLVIWSKAGSQSLECAGDCPKDFGSLAGKTPNNKSGTYSVVAAVVPLITRSPDHYVIAAARGLEPDLNECILKLQGEHTDLACAFREMNAASYSVRLESISNQDVSPVAAVQWSGQGPLNAAFTGLKIGTYRLLTVGADGEPAGAEAWVLLSDPDHFAPDTAAFDKARKEVESLPSQDTDPRFARITLRAYLEFLANQPQRKSAIK
jgi:hypothetical protein